MDEFMKFKKALRNHFDDMQKESTHLFEVNVDKDELWNVYLDSFPTGTNDIFRERREHDCSCCRQFIKNIGSAVIIKDNQIHTIWELNLGDTIYQPVCDALDTFIKSHTVTDIYITKFPKIGTDYNFEEINGKSHRWDHFYLELPNKFVNKTSRSDEEIKGQFRDTRNVFKRSLDEITMKARDTILAANVGFVYVYKKAGDCELIKASDITLAEWADWADGVWNISNSGIGHTTPFAEELVKRCIKLWSCPGDTVLDPFAGAGTVNKVAIENSRNAIGIELNKEFYDLANEKRFNLWDDSMFNSDDSVEAMKERFEKELLAGKEQSANAKAEKEEKKVLTQKKKDLRAEIKELEAQLNALGMKKSEIKKLKDEVKEEVTE